MSAGIAPRVFSTAPAAARPHRVSVSRLELRSRWSIEAVPQRKEFEGFSYEHYGLKTLETEVYRGFVFVRLKSRLPASLRCWLPTPMSWLVSTRRASATRARRLAVRDVNWKMSRIIIPMPCTFRWRTPVLADCRPKLRRRSAALGRQDVGPPADAPSSQPSERNVSGILPRVPHLPDARQRL